MANNYESLKTDGHYTLAYRIFLKMRNWVESLFYGERVHFCTCTNSASDSIYTVTSADTFTLKTGTIIIVDFQHGFNLFHPINVNSTGQKYMRYSGLSDADGSLHLATNVWYRVSLLMVYDGTTWSIVSELGDCYKYSGSVLTGSSYDNYFQFANISPGSPGLYSIGEVTNRIYYNINSGTLTIKNNSDNDPYMSYKNDDIVINSSTWDGTNTSLKTTLGTLDQIDDSYDYDDYEDLPDSTKMMDKIFMVRNAPIQKFAEYDQTTKTVSFKNGFASYNETTKTVRIGG